MVAVGDYAAISKVSEDIDKQFKGVHDAEYFRNLLGVLAGLERDRSEFSYDRRWAIRKLQWKILLTKHSNTKDAYVILKMKDWLCSFGFASTGVSIFADNDQFVALRLDAAALLWSYRDCLREWTIPNYRRKPERGPTSVTTLDPVVAAQEDAEARLREAELTQNAYDNEEQYELSDSLRHLNNAASWLISGDFSWPPEDNATVAKLLDTFPPVLETRERLLKELDHLRQRHQGEYEELRKDAASAAQQQK